MTAVPPLVVPPPGLSLNDKSALGGQGFITVTCVSDLQPASVKWKIKAANAPFALKAKRKKTTGKSYTITFVSTPKPADATDVQVFPGKTTTIEIGFNP